MKNLVVPVAPPTRPEIPVARKTLPVVAAMPANAATAAKAESVLAMIANAAIAARKMLPVVAATIANAVTAAKAEFAIASIANAVAAVAGNKKRESYR